MTSNPFFQSGLSSRDYIQDAVFERVIAGWSQPDSSTAKVVSRCASVIADIPAACEDAVVTGRSKREFADLVDEFIGLVLSKVAQCHIAHGRSPADEWLQIEAIAISIVNDGFAKMGPDIRVAHTAEGPLIHDRGAGLPSFPGAQCLWDDLGLPRETDVPGQSWDSNGISTFFHSLDFADFRYWDAIYWRTGYIDRRAGERRYSFVEEYDRRASNDRSGDPHRRARFFADHSDKNSPWFRLARSWRMRDHMILTFETNRTRSIDTVDLPGKHDLRQRYHSPDPAVGSKAQIELAAWALGRENAIPQIEAILGRSHYELINLTFGTNSTVTDSDISVNDSVDAAVDDIVHEALRLMSILHVRPYMFWASETELMIAAARPGSNAGPWSRAAVESAAPSLAGVNGLAVGGNDAGLLEWSNELRIACEPGCDWDSIMIDDAHLKCFWMERPHLERFLNSESWFDDDRTLMHRLVRLSRFGYGLPQVRKPEYRDVHMLP